MGKILKPGASCDRCGVQEDADKQMWIKSNYGLYSYCQNCFKKGEPCNSCKSNDKLPSEQPCASCHQSYDGFNWWNYEKMSAV